MASSAASLDGFPAEITKMIVENVTRIDDIKSLCRVSRRFHALAKPSLWNSIVLRPLDEFQHFQLNGQSFEVFQSWESNLQRVRQLHVDAPFHQNLSSSRSEFQRDENAGTLTAQLAKIFILLKPDQLRNFSWNMGSYQPDHLQSFFGGGPRHLFRLEALETLKIVNGPCHKDPAITTWTFDCKNLRHLSWVDTVPDSQYEALRELLKNNAPHLESLEISHLAFYNHNFLRTILFCGVKRIGVRFPNLSRLSLSNVSFSRTQSDMLLGCNFFNLQSLKLLNCVSTIQCLNYLLEGVERIKIKVLELSVDERSSYDNILRFLAKCDSLEVLCLLTRPFKRTSDYWASILALNPPLKRFVYHERLEFVPKKYFRDARPFHLKQRGTNFLPDYPHMADNAFEELLKNTGLEFLAICDTPEALARRFKAMDPNDLTFKVLHVRASGIDKTRPDLDQLPKVFEMGIHRRTRTRTTRGGAILRTPVRVEGLRELLEWAFGPKGPPNLRVVAYGDFSYDGRYAEHNSFFCKREPPIPRATTSVLGMEKTRIFRVVEKKDVLWDDVITPVKHLLAACPVDQLMSSLMD